MRRNNNSNRKVKSIVVLLVFAIALSACKGVKPAENAKIPAATYMGGDNTLAEVRKELNAAGVSHVDTFEEWVSDFANTAGKKAKLEDTWSEPEKLNADISKCMDGWEDHHDFSDANCRMTAFLLLDGLLKADSTEENYQGTYLMFDTEAIDGVERYALLRDNKDMFTTLFGEKTIVDEAHPETTFSDSYRFPEEGIPLQNRHHRGEKAGGQHIPRQHFRIAGNNMDIRLTMIRYLWSVLLYKIPMKTLFL